MPVADAIDLFDGDFLTRLERVRLRLRRILSGVQRAERRSRRTGSSLEFADHRNYTPGDDPRRIDWGIYGRLERLMVKLYEEEEDLDVTLLIDISASMTWQPDRSQAPAKLALARQLAAALAYLSLHNLDRVRIGFFDAELRQESSPYRGKSAFHEVLRILRSPPEAGGATDFATSLGGFGRSQNRRGLVLILSDGLDPEGFARGLAAVTGRHFAMHFLHLLHPAECDPDLRGDLRLQDCEGGAEVDVTAAPALLTAYRTEVEKFRAELRSWCTRHEAGYSFIRSDMAFDDVVLRLFREDGLVR